MKGKEFRPTPTGHFPSIETEYQSRFQFLKSNNPLFSFIWHELKSYGVKRHRKEISQNLLAFYYGVDFYNQLTMERLFSSQGYYPVFISYFPASEALIHTNFNLNMIIVNLACQEAKRAPTRQPLDPIGMFDEPEVAAPAYIYHLLAGIEEASHLDLFRLHESRNLNPHQRTNHRNPHRLWFHSDENSIAYKAKLWHEFAALTVQRSYVNYYLQNEFPQFTEEFNNFFLAAKRERRRWLLRKQKQIATVDKPSPIPLA